ncbi:MAG: aldehyde dehydrogenase family protein [Verrucomicrobia bacterium]|nr:aldehyde dehydrogenase family protein [Verrucomicrobiota bacterium]
MTTKNITLKLGDKEFKLGNHELARVSLKEATFDEHPEIGASLKRANIGIDLAPDLAPMLDEDQAYMNYIDGEWVSSETDRFRDNVNPANRRELLGRTPVSTSEEVDRAMKAADRDFMEWMAISGDFKLKAFLRVAELLKAHAPDLERIMCREMGKTLFDCHLDVAEAIGVVEVVAPMALSMKGATHQKIANGTAMECRLSPRGVAAIITPFNFPLAIPIAQVVAALVTGNTVVWKPSHLTPEISHAMVSLIVTALKDVGQRMHVRVPRGILNMFFGGGSATASHPIPKVIHFTGSKEIGDKVDSVASSLGKRVMKEVAGINITYVHRAADLASAAKQIVYGKSITGGQRCSSIQEVLVDHEVYDKLVEALSTEAKNIVTGDGMSKEVADADATPGRYSLPPLADDEQLKHVTDLLGRSIKEGARVVYQDKLPAELLEQGFYHPFTIVTDVDEKNCLYYEEVFGPVLVVTKVRDIHEAITIINNKIGIVGCIHSEDKNATEFFIERVLRTRIDDGRHGTGCFWSTKFGGDRGAGSGNAALDCDMVYSYVIFKTVYRQFSEPK